MKKLLILFVLLLSFSSCTKLKKNEIQMNGGCKLFSVDSTNYVILSNKTYIISDEATYRAILKLDGSRYNELILTVNKNKVTYAY